MLFQNESVLTQYLSFKAANLGRGCGEFCEHWIDPNEFHAISSMEKRTEYYERGFVPSLRIYAEEGKMCVKVTCVSCNWKRFHHTELTAPELFCKKQFPTLEKLLEEEFNKFLRKDSA